MYKRQGLTRANLEGRYIGRTDLPLCPEGRAQLEKLRDTCEYPWAERVYASPLLRARQTAELLYPGRPLEPLDKLRELDFGAFENRTITDLEQDPAFRAWIAAPAGAAPPQGESAAALLGRAVEAVAYIFARMMEERVTSVAVVTHGALIMNPVSYTHLDVYKRQLWESSSAM